MIQTLANEQKLFICKQYEFARHIGLFASWFMSEYELPSFGYLQKLWLFSRLSAGIAVSNPARPWMSFS